MQRQCREFLETESRVGIVQGHDVGGHHQNLLNYTWPYDIMSQHCQKAYTTCADHVVHEDEILLGEDPEVLGVISIPCALASDHHFHVCHQDEADFF